VKTITVGTHPVGLAYNPSNNLVYVANYGSSSISVIEAFANVVSTTIAVGANPYAVAYDPANNDIYVGNGTIGNPSQRTAITVISPTNSVVDTLVSPSGSGPVLSIAYNPKNQRLYGTVFSGGGGGNILQIDPMNNLSEHGGLSCGKPSNIIYDPTNGLMYVTCLASNNVITVDPSTFSTSIVAGFPDIPSGLGFYPANNGIFVTHGSNTVSVIDSRTNAIVQSITLVNGNSPTAAEFYTAADAMYVVNNNGGAVYAITGADFSLSQPNGLTILQGTSASTAVDLTFSSGSSELAIFGTSTLPPGVTATVSSITCKSSCQLTVTFIVSSTAPPGSPGVTITCTGAGLSREVSFTLSVVSPPPLPRVGGGTRPLEM